MESERAMTSSRSARRPSTASALGQEEQPWLVNSSTTAFVASVTLPGGAASAVSGVATWAGATPDRPAKPAMSAMSAMSRMSWTNPCSLSQQVMPHQVIVRGRRGNTRAAYACTIGISHIKCESRMGETRCRAFTDSCFPNAARGAKTVHGLGCARQVAQHKGQDAAVPVVAELLFGIDPAQHLDVA